MPISFIKNRKEESMRLSKCVIFFVLISCVFYSCGNKKESGAVTFKASSIQKKWDDRLIIDECVALNANDSIILSTVSKCLVDNNQIIVYDKKNRRIFTYTKEGQFKCQIGREGRAKSEYLNIKDIAFSRDHTLLYVLDDIGIIIYDAWTGKYVNREKIELRNFTNYWKFAILDEGHYLLFNPQEDGLGEIVEYLEGDWKDVRKAGFYQFACERFYEYEDNIRVIPSFGEFNICTFEDGNLTPSFKVEFDNNMLPTELKPKSFNEFLKTSEEGKWFSCILSAHETSSWLYANVIGPKQTCYWVFANKEDGGVFYGPMPTDDGMQIVDSDSDFFYAIVYPELIGEHSYMKNVINDKSESSNTLYLVSFHIKKEKENVPS